LVFKDVWNLGDTRIDQLLKISTKQGVCGKAFKSGNLYGAQFVSTPATKYNFTTKQLKLTEDLKIVVSCPINVIEEQAEEQSGKIIGVLNAESDSSGSKLLILDNNIRKNFYKELIVLSILCSKLM